MLNDRSGLHVEVGKVERLYRIIFLGLFIVGFIGAVASADRTGEDGLADSPVISLIRDVRLAQEVNQLNAGRWNADGSSVNNDSLDRVEKLLAAQK